MTTNYHTAIAIGAAADAATFNTPLGALDSAITNRNTGVYSVLDYGAVGDGVTDDTAAFQDAITAAAAYANHCTVLVPDTGNDYIITGTIVLNAGIRLVGTGRNSDSPARPTRIVHNPSTPGDHLLELETDGLIYGCGISNLHFYGSADSGDGLHLVNSVDCSVTECVIRNFVNGISISSGMTTRVEDTFISHCSNSGILVTGGTNTTITVTRTYMTYCAWGAILDSDDSKNTMFQDSIFESNTDGGLNVYKGSTATLINCYMEDIPNPTGAKPLIRVGVDGTTVNDPQDVCAIYIHGGAYAGFNGVVPANSKFLELDYCYLAAVYGVDVRRVDKIVTSTANTFRIELFGLTALQVGGTPWSGINDPGRVLGGMFDVRAAGVVPDQVLRSKEFRMYGTSSTYWRIYSVYSVTNPDLIFNVNGDDAIRMDANKRIYTVGGIGVGNSATAGTNEVQTITIDATGGTWTCTYSGQTTAALDYNITAAALQTALTGLSSIGAGHVTVTGGPGATADLVCTFAGALGSTDLAAMTTNAASLTGGASTATVVESTPGVAAVLTGPLIKKIQIFDANGNSLGYVPIYDVIT